jgi:uncharacterized membrane-anchored protein
MRPSPATPGDSLGATIGDLLTKPMAKGGLNLSRVSSSLLIAVFRIGWILFIPQKTGSHLWPP